MGDQASSELGGGQTNTGARTRILKSADGLNRVISINGEEIKLRFFGVLGILALIPLGWIAVAFDLSVYLVIGIACAIWAAIFSVLLYRKHQRLQKCRTADLSVVRK